MYLNTVEYGLHNNGTLVTEYKIQSNMSLSLGLHRCSNFSQANLYIYLFNFVVFCVVCAITIVFLPNHMIGHLPYQVTYSLLWARLDHC